MESAAPFVAAFPGLIAVTIGAAQVARSRVVRRHAGGARIALVALTFLAIGACHSIDRDAFAHAPIAQAALPLREPLTYTIGANAGQSVVLQNGLLGSYYAGAQFDRLDHQQIDPNVEFFWDATGNPVISAPDGIDTNEGDFRLPDTWGIWSIVWEGYLLAPADGSYLLRLHVNNGGWLQTKDDAGALLTTIDCAGGTSFEGDCDATVGLRTGPNYIRISYFNNAPPSADAIFSWQPPSASSVATVPTSALCTQRAATCRSTRRPIVFVPGLLGSELEAKANGSITLTESDGNRKTRDYHTGDILWPHFSSFPDVLTPTNDPEYYDLMRLDEQGVPLIPSGPNGKLYTAASGYAEVEPFLVSQGYVTGHDLFLVGWDWRFTPESQVGYLSTAVAKALSATGADSVDIIAHSQGTFLTKAFLQTSIYRGNVAHVVLAGMPNYGAPKAVDALLYGQCAQQVGPICALKPQTNRYVIRTMPGVVSDNVAPSYYEFFQNQIAPEDFRPIPYVVLPSGPEPIPAEQFSYAFLRQTLIARGVPEAVLTKAEAFHRDDTTWLGDVLRDTHARIALAGGSGHCAYGQVRVSTRPEISRDLFGHVTVTTRTALDYVTIDGDSIVPRQSATQGTGLTADFASGLPVTDRLFVYVRDRDHGGLVDHNGLPDALKFLRDEPMDPGDIATMRNNPCPILSVHSPAELVVTDGAGRRTGGTGDDEAQLIEIPGVVYDRFDDMKVVRFERAGAYTAQLSGTADGETTVRMRWIEGTATREVIFLHVPTSARSKASLTVDTATRAVSALALDLDGDGVIDQTIAPTILLGAAATDLTPPALSLTAPSSGQVVVGSFPLNWSATDAGSGVESSFAAIDRGLPTEVFVAHAGDNVQLTPGMHPVQVFAEDHAGNVTRRDGTLVADAYAWLPSIGADGSLQGNAGRTVPAKFTVTNAAGAFVKDASVQVDLVDAVGTIVLGPLSLAASPDEGVAIEQTMYHADISTKTLRAGTYTVRAHFGSPVLLGQFTATLVLR